jgi:hypothetical protein
MRRKAKERRPEERNGNLLAIFVVALAVVLLLLRMLVFVNGAGRHGVRRVGSAVPPALVLNADAGLS